MLVLSPMSSSMPVSMPGLIQMYLGFATSYNYSSIVLQTLIVSLFYRVGSLAQLPSRRLEDTQWKVRTTPHSSTKEGNREKDKDEAEGGNEDEYEDEDDDRDKDELTPLVMRRNPACTR